MIDLNQLLASAPGNICIPYALLLTLLFLALIAYAPHMPEQ